MKLANTISFTLLLLAGCGGSNSKQASAPAIEEPPRPKSASSTTIEPRVTKLLRTAGQAEAEFRFDEAATVWREIRSLLVAQHGGGHWQVANSEHAIATDERLARLGPAGRSSLEQLRSLEQRATKHSQAGALRRALKCVDQARPLARQVFGEIAALPLRLDLMAGQLAQQMGEWKVAHVEFERALALAQQLYAPPHPDLELANFQLGIVERQAGDLNRSIALLQLARQMTESLVGRDATFAARTRDLGVSLHRAGRFDEALHEFEITEQIWRTVLGESHPLVAECLVNQAVVKIDQQQWRDAEIKLASAEQIAQANSPSTSLQNEIWLHMATLRVVGQDFAAATQELQKALEFTERQSGRLNPQYAHVAYRMAMCLSFQTKFDQAEPLFRHALEVQGNLLGKSHDQTRKTLQGLAMLLQRTDRPAEAQTLLRDFSYTATEAPATTTQ